MKATKTNFISLGNAAFLKKKYKLALSCYSEAIKVNPWAKGILKFNIELSQRKIQEQAFANKIFIEGDDGNFGFFLDRIQIENFNVYLSAWVVNLSMPRLPVRLSVYIGDRFIKDLIARQEIGGGEDLENAGFGFNLNFSIRESEINQNIKIVPDNSSSPHFISLKPHEKNISSTRPKSDSIREINDADVVIGSVDAVSYEFVTGWALVEDGDPQIELCLYIDGIKFSTIKTSVKREDVKNKFGVGEYSGFVFEIPPVFSKTKRHKIDVIPVKGINKIKNFSKILDVTVNNYVDSTFKSKTGYELSEILEDRPVKTSVIILNRNGDHLLSDFFESTLNYIDHKNIEWIIVDHNSIDSSREVCNNFIANGLNILFENRGRNYNFSESNNFGASIASGDILVFANNDLIFKEDPFGNLRQVLGDKSVKIAGVKLVDHTSEVKNTIFSVQHLSTHFHTRVDGKKYLRPFEARLGDKNFSRNNEITKAPAVTGAFLAIRKDDFKKIKGFDESYNYGLEDVDLCLKALKYLGGYVVSINTTEIIHHRGFSRNKDDFGALRRKNNNDNFTKRWAQFLRGNIRNSIFLEGDFWIGRIPRLAFIVTDAGDNTSAGEYYTAKEMGDAIQEKLNIDIIYLTENNWYDLAGVDVLITMVNKFNLHKAKNVSPYLLTINWTRQWFDRWASDETIYSYDFIFASSNTAATYIREKTCLPVDVLPIASNTKVFGHGFAKDEYLCDYVFTGSKFGIGREIEYSLNPDDIKGRGAIYGYNWDGTIFENISKGSLSYSELPHLYASTKIVIDDANIATKPWGSCNSRVFDSLASGCLLITNGAIGVNEIFGDLVPVYKDSESLTKTINYWLSNEDERKQRVAVLQKIVQNNHSYESRVNNFIKIIGESKARLRISIKCPAKEKEKMQWGDYHFACSLAKELREIGAIVRIDCREDWYRDIGDCDDVVLVLRGLVEYKPKNHQLNFVWLISHPDMVTVAELSLYDHVFVASEFYADHLRNILNVPVSTLLQCFDSGIFDFNKSSKNFKSDRVIFVGNSRGVYRESVRFAIECGVDLHVYGTGWESLIEGKYIKGQLVPNESLFDLYATSRFVLCDHWEDMKRLGFISNRVFDVVASGGTLLTDNVSGINNLNLPKTFVYSNIFEFNQILSSNTSPLIDNDLSEFNEIIKYYSFEQRALEIMNFVKKYIEE